jgi:uncharacterized protein YfaS (alpha-2-macroglobulin family)
MARTLLMLPVMLLAPLLFYRAPEPRPDPPPSPVVGPELGSVEQPVAVPARALVPAPAINPDPEPALVPAPAPAPSIAAADDEEAAEPEGLKLALSEGERAPAPIDDRDPVAAQRLADAEIEALLARLPPLPAPLDDGRVDLPVVGASPPRTGGTRPLDLASSGGPGPETTAPGPLTVLRITPEDERPLVGVLSVTFSDPMVPLAALDVVDGADVPVTLSPQPPGRWRWIDPRLAVFEAEGRFPAATRYEVSVPAGTTSTSGQRLQQGVHTSFSTPALRVVRHVPSGTRPVGVRPLVLMAFDQAVVPETLMPFVRLESWGLFSDTRHPVQMLDRGALDPEELESLGDVVLDRVLALQPVGDLPADQELTLTLAAGAPSAEGPRVTTAPQELAFSTRGSLRVESRNGTWLDPLAPGDSISVRFTNPLLDEQPLSERITFDPPMPNLRMSAYSNYLAVGGDFPTSSSFTLRLSGDLEDDFGQRLGDDIAYTIHTDSMPAAYALPGASVAVLDPAAPPALILDTVNLDEVDVTLRQVSPGFWHDYQAQVRDHRDLDPDDVRVGKLLKRVELEPGGRLDERRRTALGLADAFENDLGHVVAIVEADVEHNPFKVQWIQRTQLALDAATDGRRLLVWVTSLKDGAPVAGARVGLLRHGEHAVTDTGGLALLELPEGKREADALVATLGDDSVVLPEGSWAWRWRNSSDWVAESMGRRVVWAVFDDRGTYRPGELVRVKGWVRLRDEDRIDDFGEPPQASLAWTLTGPRRHDWAKGTLALDAFGGFDLALDLPADADPGQARLRLSLDGLPLGSRLRGESMTHRIKVAEFRRPEYEVTVKAESALSVVGGSVDLTARAAYYAGSGLPDAELDWTLRASDGSYAPPGWSDFSFGTDGGAVWSSHGRSSSEPWTWSARTDALGEHRLHVELLSVDPPKPMLLSAEAKVADVNGQRWAGSAQRLVHPADEYVGLAATRGFVRAGEPARVRVVTVDLDGGPVAGRSVALRAVREGWVYDAGTWTTEELDVVERGVTTDATPVTVALDLPSGGRWKVTAHTTDGEGRPNAASLSLWVAGAEDRPPVPRVELESLELLPDAETVAPGETLDVLVVAPFTRGEGLATLNSGPTLWTERFSLADGSHVLSVPVTEANMPHAVLRVEVVGSAPRADAAGRLRTDLPPRPAHASGSLTVDVSRESAELTVAVEPERDTTTPGDSLEVSIAVTDARGAAVPGANVALVVADEAVLALKPWKAPDPLASLMPARWYTHDSERLRPLVVLGDPELRLPGGWPQETIPRSVLGEGEDDLIEESLGDDAFGALRSLGYNGGGSYEDAAPSAAAAPVARMAMSPAAPGAPSAGADPVSLRSVFDALASYQPDLITDEAGRVTATLDLPDNLTRYRITAVVLDRGVRAGVGESALTARLPLMVRPSPPRVLNLGDRVELPVVVQNDTDEDRVVDLVAQSVGLTFLEGAGRRVTVPAFDRVEVRLDAEPLSTGTAHLSVLAVDHEDPDRVDAALLHWPVLEPAVKEAFAMYGTLDDDSERLSVVAPEGALPGFGGLEVTTSSTAMAALTDALLAVGDYPYGCSEQRASRVLSVLALADVLDAFEVPGRPGSEERQASVDADLAHVLALQNGDGGFPFWRKGKRSDPFLTAHVVHALLVARSHDRAVPDEALAEGLEYLDDLPAHIAGMPYTVSERARLTILAYGLWVEDQAGRKAWSRAADLVGGGTGRMDGEALAWLLPVLGGHQAARSELALVRKELLSRVSETAAGAHLTSAQEQDGHVLLHGKRRGTAVLLDSLLRTEPGSDLVPKLVQWLLGHRVEGHWGTTQENVFALLSLRRAFDVLESQVPDNRVRAWLGERPLVDERFVGRDVTRRGLTLPVSQLAELAGPDGAELVLDEDGPGRLYWRLGLRYARDLEDPQPESRGFSVSRTYESLGDPDDVRRDPDGSWRIRRGATVRVRLSMLAPATRHHVALVDRLPAGLEPLDTGLAVTEAVPDDEPQAVSAHDYWRCFWWGGPWYEHAALRDAGAEVFASSVGADLHSYGYAVRATTPGRFVAPPARAEEMYAPESFGRSASDVIIVE